MRKLAKNGDWMAEGLASHDELERHLEQRKHSTTARGNQWRSRPFLLRAAHDTRLREEVERRDRHNGSVVDERRDVLIAHGCVDEDALRVDGDASALKTCDSDGERPKGSVGRLISVVVQRVRAVPGEIDAKCLEGIARTTGQELRLVERGVGRHQLVVLGHPRTRWTITRGGATSVAVSSQLSRRHLRVVVEGQRAGRRRGRGGDLRGRKSGAVARVSNCSNVHVDRGIDGRRATTLGCSRGRGRVDGSIDVAIAESGGRYRIVDGSIDGAIAGNGGRNRGLVDRGIDVENARGSVRGGSTTRAFLHRRVGEQRSRRQRRTLLRQCLRAQFPWRGVGAVGVDVGAVGVDVGGGAVDTVALLWEVA